MRLKKNAFIDTIMDLWMQIGLRPEVFDPLGPVKLSIDAVDILLSARSDDTILIEALAHPIANSEKKRIQQLRTALKINIGLSLNCKASLYLTHNSNNSPYLAAHSVYQFTVNNTRHLIEIINDTVRLVEFVRHASKNTNLSTNIKSLERAPSPMVIIEP